MATLYDRKLLNKPTVSLSFNDPIGGLLKPSQVELHLSNDDHFFDGVNLRGERITYSRFDKNSLETWEELTGTVVSQEWRVGKVILRTVAHDLSVFQTLLPKEIVTAATFPLADPQQGLGRPIPIIFGTAASTNKVNDAWELPWVGDNTGSNYYDYLLGRGTFTNVSVYRDTVGDKLFLVPGSEYTVNTAAYSGFTVIRFALRQRSFGGGFHRIFAAADVSGGSRNFATSIQSMLSNSTWGLGLSVNAASFTAGASALDTIGSLYCDGAITEQREAQDYLTQLLTVRGMTLTQNSSGEYVLAVDTAATTVKGLFGHGLGQAANGVAEDGFEGLETTPMSEAIKSLVLDYRPDRWTGKPVLATSSRSIFAYGEERRIQNDFIRNPTTADKTACYWANRHIYGDERLSFRAGQMARMLRPGEVIRYQSMQPTFNKYYACRDIDRDLTTSRIYAVGWSADIYTYTAGTIPGEPGAGTDTDWSRSTPTAPSSLSIASSGVESDGQNAYMATVTLQYTAAAETWAQTYIRVRRNGTTNWETVAQSIATGASLQTQITGLITGARYDYMVERVNTMNPTLSASVSLSNQTAPVDTDAPDAPTGVTVSWQQFKTITITFTLPAGRDFDFWEWEIRTAASGGGSLVASGTSEGRGAKITINVSMIAYSSTRYLRIRGVDYTGNTGSYSSSTSFSLSQVVSDDVGTDQITTAKVPIGAMTASGVYTNDSGSDIGVSEAEIGTITIVGEANQPFVLIGYGGYTKTANPGGINVKIRKTSIGGTILGQGRTELVAGGDDTMCVVGYDATPAASQTYKLTAYYDGSAGASYYDIRIIAINLKR